MENKEKIEFIKEKPPNIFRRFVIIFLTLFLLIIIIIYFVTDFNIRNILTGLILSNKIQDNNVKINSNNKLIFENNIYNELIKIYDINIGKEFKVCLKGYIKNEDYYINEIYIPETYFQSSSQVIAEPCSDDSIVDMHSHPLKHCLPSEQDIISFNRFKERNNNAIMAVICQRNRFNFYT